MIAFKKPYRKFDNKLEVDLAKNWKLNLFINFVGLILFFIFYFLFFYISKLLNIVPYHSNSYTIYFYELHKNSLFYSVLFLAAVVAVMFLHEMIHGFFFYLFTKEKPKIGFKNVFAYAAAPEWYIKKKFFYYVVLSPLILITIFSFIIMALFPLASSIVFLVCTSNAAGSFGDIWMAFKMIKLPSESYIKDFGVSSEIIY